MKTFLTIFAGALFCSVFPTPSEDATLSTYLLWLIWSCGALFIVSIIFKETEKWDEEDRN